MYIYAADTLTMRVDRYPTFEPVQMDLAAERGDSFALSGETKSPAGAAADTVVLCALRDLSILAQMHQRGSIFEARLLPVEEVCNAICKEIDLRIFRRRPDWLIANERRRYGLPGGPSSTDSSFPHHAGTNTSFPTLLGEGRSLTGGRTRGGAVASKRKNSGVSAYGSFAAPADRGSGMLEAHSGGGNTRPTSDAYNSEAAGSHADRSKLRLFTVPSWNSDYAASAREKRRLMQCTLVDYQNTSTENAL
eukprot:GHVT01002806.1.p1 GENE.GHVT01002806.1~~GHVT01002806.1.p1  ORF type:complete len:249 (+),score=33.58 GHVT01002806.1:323-1069(+)